MPRILQFITLPLAEMNTVRLRILALLLCPATIAFAEQLPPRWIWSDAGDRMSAGSETTAERVFVAEGEIERATLRATADFAELTVSLNGKPVLQLDSYDPPAEADV